jgi:hypothetical protein
MPPAGDTTRTVTPAGSLARVAVAAAAAQAAAFGLIAGVVTRVGWYSFFQTTDLHIYRQYALDMARGLHPYAGFFMEYPPLAALVFALAGTGDKQSYMVAFAVWMFVAIAAAAGLCAVTATIQTGERRRGYRVAIAFGLLTLVTGAIVANRYDAVVALVVAALLLALTSRHWRMAGLLVGLGFALKLTPLVLLPLVLALPSRRRDVVAAATWCAAGGIGPFAVLLALDRHMAGAGMAGMFVYHLTRPLEVESVLAAPLLALHSFGAIAVKTGAGANLEAFSAPGAGVMTVIGTVATLAALGACYRIIWTRRYTLRRSPRALPLAALSILLAYVTFGKVLSAQYLIWLLPAAALVAADSRRLALGVGAAALLTQIEFPAMHAGLLALQPFPTFIVVVRGLVLLATFAAVLRTLMRQPVFGPEEPAPG